ncbi:hypothetical protein TNCV_1604201 [Trichonephila clavipes]|nr:hypothetical protein TNCV_1604201 [Trichonephila clavipes]
MVLKATANDRRHLVLCHDEFRGPRYGLCRSGGISNNNITATTDFTAQTHIPGDRSATRKLYIREEQINDWKYHNCFFVQFFFCFFAQAVYLCLVKDIERLLTNFWDLTR